MKKLGLLKVGSVVLCTLTGAFASDTTKWDSIQNLDSFVQFLIDDKASKINDIDKILDYLKANAPDRFNAICGPVKAGQNVKNNIREWEAPYNTKLSQQKISKINFKCMNTVVDTNLRPKKMELQPLDDMAKFEAPPVPEAPKIADLPPRVPSPKPAAPAPQMSLDDMMDAEISGSWEQSDSPSASKAPSRSNTPEPVVETPEQKAEREKAERLRLQGLGDVTSVTTVGLEGSMIFYAENIPKLSRYIEVQKKPFEDYKRYIEDPKFQGQYADLSKELFKTIKQLEFFQSQLRANFNENDTLKSYDQRNEGGVYAAIRSLAKLKEAMKRDLPAPIVVGIDFNRPGDADVFYGHYLYKQNRPQIKTSQDAENAYFTLKSTIDGLHFMYAKILNDFRKFYAQEKAKYDAMPD